MSEIIGRDTGDYHPVDKRADTTLHATMSEQFCCGAIGTAVVKLRKSVDGCDRGGLILSLSIRDDGSCMVPHAVSTHDGVDIHMCGDIEAEILARCILRALETRNDVPRSGIVFQIPEHAERVRCSSPECGAEIVWIRTNANKSMPANIDGTSHFGTCPAAASFRKRNAR